LGINFLYNAIIKEKKAMKKFVKTGTKYEVDLSDEDTPVRVKVGGEIPKFVPNVNMSKWHDECWLNMNHPDVVGPEIEKFENERVELVVGNNTHRYSLVGGTMVYEIVFAQRPVLSRVQFNLNFPDGLMFWYQPPLTQEEIDEGAERPENVVGSYAVYWKKRNNQYKTGKFCHIFRPRLIDIWGEWTWAEVEVKGKVLIFKMDSNWLDSAHYPVTLG
jgi:hypothetical protein